MATFLSILAATALLGFLARGIARANRPTKTAGPVIPRVRPIGGDSRLPADALFYDEYDAA